MNMLKKWMTVCLCIFGLWAGAAQARDITFDLRDTNGPVTQKSYPGKYLLLAIGYTSCPDICPTTLYEYGLVMKALKNPDAIQPIFVTIDPVSDDVERLNTYTRFFDERIVGLTGEMKNIQALADQLGATFGYRMDGKKVDNPKPGMSYTVYHSALIYLIDPDRKLMDVFDYQIGAKGLTEALDKVLGALKTVDPKVTKPFYLSENTIRFVTDDNEYRDPRKTELIFTGDEIFVTAYDFPIVGWGVE